MPTLHKRQFLKLALAGGAALALSACGGGSDLNVYGRISLSPDLSLLQEAIEAAGLQDTLRGDGPFTVFAPTNAAFEALLAELGVTKQALFADRATLTAVLTYHVLGARVEAADIPFGRAITTVQGGIFKIEAEGGASIQDGRNRTARIIATDIEGGNGVVHKIDKVLLPANLDIVATAQSISTFSTLVAAVGAAGLVSTLQQPGPFTVFAPTNAAFDALLAEYGLTLNDLTSNTSLLTAVLTYHVLPARVLAAEVPIDTDITTVQGNTLSIDSDYVITDQVGRTATITATDVFASNGVIHVIDRVILPFDLAS